MKRVGKGRSKKRKRRRKREIWTLILSGESKYFKPDNEAPRAWFTLKEHLITTVNWRGRLFSNSFLFLPHLLLLFKPLGTCTFSLNFASWPANKLIIKGCWLFKMTRNFLEVIFRLRVCCCNNVLATCSNAVNVQEQFYCCAGVRRHFEVPQISIVSKW